SSASGRRSASAPTSFTRAARAGCRSCAAINILSGARGTCENSVGGPSPERQRGVQCGPSLTLRVRMAAPLKDDTMGVVAVTVMAVVVPMLTAAAFLLGRHFHRRPARGDELSAVTRQHIDLFQGGQLNQNLVDAAKIRLRELLERGEVAAVEASLRPGM